MIHQAKNRRCDLVYERTQHGEVKHKNIFKGANAG